MNFEDFSKAVLNQIPDYISGTNYRYFLSDVAIINHEEDCALHIEELYSTSKAIPSFYLKSFFNLYKESTSIESILIQIAKLYGDFLENQYLTRTTSCYKDHVIMNLIHTNRNEHQLEYLYHKPLLDLSIVYQYAMDEDMKEFLPVRNDLIDIKDMDNYHEKAMNNTKLYLGINYIPMEEANGKSESNETKDRNLNSVSKKRGGITMVTNKIHQFGAAILAIPEYMEELSSYLDDDLIIIPSSIHEIGIIKYSEIQISIDKLRDMVQTINRNDLDSSVVLSDNLYLYSRNDKELRILE